MTKFAKAFKDWSKSKEGKKCLEGSADGNRLKYRLHRAFEAGYEALIKFQRKP